MASEFKMADGVEFKIEGAGELLVKLKAVTFDMQKKGGRFALRKAAQVIRDQARQNAARVNNPATTAEISKNIVERWDGKLFKRTGDMAFRVGVLGGARAATGHGEFKTSKNDTNPGGDTFYWRFLEFGTSDIPAQPLLRPAADQAGSKATSEYVVQYSKALDRALKRAKKS